MKFEKWGELHFCILFLLKVFLGHTRTHYFCWKYSSNDFFGNFYSKWNIQNCNQTNIANRFCSYTD